VRTLLLVTLAAMLTGCSSEVTGSAAPGGEPRQLPDAERQESFCRDVPALISDITDDLQDVQTDPASAIGALDEAVSRMEAVQPPDDVTDEWERLVAVWRDLRDLLGRADLSDPQANADLAPELVELQPELVDAGGAVDDWGQANC
jgi:uncharacterized membrane protein YccC